MIGADLIARILKAEGVDFMGVIPMNRLEEAAAKVGIRPLIFRQERVGVNLADGYSRVTNGRGTGVFAMQAGPGAENAYAGVAQAFADSVPILLLPASAQRDRHGVHPTFSPSRSYEHVTKWAGQASGVESIPEVMRRAFSQLRLGRPSPVLLDLPADVLRGQVPDGVGVYTPVERRMAAGDRRPHAPWRDLPRHTGRPGRAVRRGVRRAARAGRVAPHSRDDHHGRQERLPREPRACAGHALRHYHRAGRQLHRA